MAQYVWNPEVFPMWKARPSPVFEAEQTLDAIPALGALAGDWVMTSPDGTISTLQSEEFERCFIAKE